MATSISPSALAAAIAAGVQQKTAQSAYNRSQYLAAALAELQKNGGNNIRSGGQLGLNLLAMLVAQHGKTSADAQVAAIQRRVAAARYPNDPKAQLLYLTAPDEMNKASVARDYTPIDVRQGNTVLNAPTPSGNYTAPVLHDDGGVYSTQTPTGVSITGARPANYQEQTAQLGQAESRRHNVADEGIQNAKIPIEMGLMNAALHNANTNAGGLGLSQINSPNFAPPPGYVLDQAPGGR